MFHRTTQSELEPAEPGATEGAEVSGGPRVRGGGGGPAPAGPDHQRPPALRTRPPGAHRPGTLPGEQVQVPESSSDLFQVQRCVLVIQRLLRASGSIPYPMCSVR